MEKEEKKKGTKKQNVEKKTLPNPSVVKEKVEIPKEEAPKKEKIQPSYVKKEPQKKVKKESSFKNVISFLRKHWMILVVALLIIVLAVFGTLYVIQRQYDKYKPYEQKMYQYGFDLLYDNKSAKTTEKVTMSEAVKLIVGMVLNTNDISSMSDTQEKYSNATWVEYARAKNIVGTNSVDVTANNANKRITLAEAILLLDNAKIEILGKKINTSVTPQFLDYNTAYSIEQKKAIADLVVSNVLENGSYRLKGQRKIVKGELNKLIIDFAEKFNTMTMDGNKLNINPEKTPDNSNLYPYILSNVSKDVYEKPFTYDMKNNVLEPIESYRRFKDNYIQMVEYVESYYNYILNIDASTINVDEFYQFMKEYTSNKPSKELVEYYVNYVKEHQIKITGSAKAQMPIVYYNGVDFVVRTKLEFTIESSNTKEDIIFYDWDNELIQEYEINKKYSKLIDAKAGLLDGTDAIKAKCAGINKQLTAK